ncbi:MAG: hypothetical protein ACK5NG_08390, partial [Chthoniobacterales bacterium]
WWRRIRPGKCGTYYFYLMDEDLGLMYVRVPTWLAGRLRAEGIDFEIEDNAFARIGDWGAYSGVGQWFFA